MGSNQPNLTMDFEPLSELMADYIADLDSSSSSSPLQRLYPPRPRCNTWPKLRYTTQVGNRGDASEEVPQYGFQDQLTGQEEQLLAQQTFNSAAPSGPLPLVCEEEFSATTTAVATPPEVMGETTFTVQSATVTPAAAAKSSSRRNPWGNLSYADLITQAIQGSPEKRLTLAQIYEWLVKNVAYFHGKGDSVSSMGWKNSIRHNLSLHSRFMRVQNEGAGKSSWWMLNPEVISKPATATAATASSSSSSTSPASAKPIRRRANTLDPSRIEHRRKGGGKLSGRQSRTPKDQLRRTLSNTSVLSDSVSLSVTDLTNPEQQQHRQRTSSSSGGGGCLSPAFRPRTFSNTSSSCDQSSPPGDEYSLDGTVPLSPCWNGTNSQYVNVSSPLFNFTERLKLEDSAAAAAAAEQELTPEDLESLKLLDLELDPKSSQLLLEAIYQEVQDQQQQQQQEHTPSTVVTAASILQQVFPNQQSTAAEVKEEEFDGQMEEDVLPTSVVETNATVIQQQQQQNGGANVPSALLPPMVNGHKIKILEPREPSTNLMPDCNGSSSHNLISSYITSPCDNSFLDMKQSRPVRGCAPLPWGAAEANNMQRELFLRKQQNEQRQLRQMKRIQEHQQRQQKLQQQQQQQSLMLSGGFVQTSNDRYPAAATAAETDYHFQQQPSFDPNHSLTTVSESANENPYYDEFLRCNVDSEEFDFDFSPMEGVDPMVVGGFQEETAIGGEHVVKQEQLQQQEGSPGVSHLFASAPTAEAASLGSC